VFLIRLIKIVLEKLILFNLFWCATYLNNILFILVFYILGCNFI